MDAYLNTMYPPGSIMHEVLGAIPQRSFRADILRYTLLLHKGGIWTDTDTAAVRKFDEWGADPYDMVGSCIICLPLSDKSNDTFVLVCPYRPTTSSPSYLATHVAKPCPPPHLPL
jgi:hypothetical protein